MGHVVGIVAVFVGNGVIGVLSLVIVVGYEDNGVFTGEPVGPGADIADFTQWAAQFEVVAQGISEVEFCYITYPVVIRWFYRLTARADNFLENIRVSGEAILDRVDISRRHMLGSVDTKAGNTEAGKVVQVVGNFLLHIVRFGFQIIEADEVTVLDGPGVAVVDIGRAVVEIVGTVRYFRKIPVPGRHMVDHRIDINVDASGFAAIHHAGKLCAAAGAAFNLVAHRLVAGPPFPGINGFLWWRDLNSGKALGAKYVFTLCRNIVPLPFEQVDEGRPRSLGTDCATGRRKNQ